VPVQGFFGIDMLLLAVNKKVIEDAGCGRDCFLVEDVHEIGGRVVEMAFLLLD